MCIKKVRSQGHLRINNAILIISVRTFYFVSERSVVTNFYWKESFLSDPLIKKNQTKIIKIKDFSLKKTNKGRNITLNREVLWQVLRMYDVEVKLLSRIKSMYVDSSACVRVKGVDMSGLG